MIKVAFNPFVLLFLIQFVIFGCGKESVDPVVSEKVREVKTAIVHSVQTDSSDRIPGNVQPAMDSTLEAKISGRIIKVAVQEGDVVKAGQKLVELDVHEIQAKLDQARASQKQADQDLNRFSRLLPAGAATKQEFDAAEARSKIANAGVAEANAMVGYSNITAPYDGLVTKKLIQEGDLALPGKPLLRIEKQNQYRFEVDVSETISARIKVDDLLDVILSGFENTLQGRVIEVSPTTDPNSRTLHIKIELPADPLLRSGQFGYVLVPIQKRPEIRIPKEALIERGQLESVFVVKDGIANLRLIRCGKRDQNEVQVLSGLTEGEVVVIEDIENLVDSERVEVAQ